MWQAKIDAVFDEINKVYVQGCISYYQIQKEDLWQIECDKVEVVIAAGNDAEIKNALDVFETNCKALVERYRK